MKAAKEQKNGWEKTLTRYFAACGIPLVWEYGTRRFRGIAGHAFPRLNPQIEEKVWARMPEYIKKYEVKEPGKQVVVIVTNRQYGDSVEDTLVVMRISTFSPLMKALIEADKERWVE